MSWLKSMAAATLGGAGLGAFGSYSGAKAAAKLSQKQAREQMAFQERMSNTAFQRAADDMEAAGLNRILALGSPATTPGGAMGTVPDFGQAIAAGANAGAGIAATAAQGATQLTSIDKMTEEIGLLGTRQQIELEKSELWKTMAPIIVQAGKDYSALLDIMKKEAPGLVQVIGRAYKDTKNAMSDWMSRNFTPEVYEGTLLHFLLENWNPKTGVIPIPDSPFPK